LRTVTAQGMTGPVRLGPLGPLGSPHRRRTALLQVHGASFGIAEAEGLHEVAFERGQHGLTS